MAISSLIQMLLAIHLSSACRWPGHCHAALMLRGMPTNVLAKSCDMVQKQKTYMQISAIAIRPSDFVLAQIVIIEHASNVPCLDALFVSIATACTPIIIRHDQYQHVCQSLHEHATLRMMYLNVQATSKCHRIASHGACHGRDVRGHHDTIPTDARPAHSVGSRH